MVELKIPKYLCSTSANKLEEEFSSIQHSHHCWSSSTDNLSEEIQNLGILQTEIIKNILFDICKDCARNMAAIPHGAFAACKLRESFREREGLISRMKKDGPKGNKSNEKNDIKYPVPNKKMLEYAPVQYNGKLMKSIWGLYNRYSPHNMKSNDDLNQNAYLQQSYTVVGLAIAENVAMVMDSAKEWGFVDK